MCFVRDIAFKSSNAMKKKLNAEGDITWRAHVIMETTLIGFPLPQYLFSVLYLTTLPVFFFLFGGVGLNPH
jgi:hypothetical protein